VKTFTMRDSPPCQRGFRADVRCTMRSWRSPVDRFLCMSAAVQVASSSSGETTSMSTLAIADVTMDTISEAIRRATGAGLDAPMLLDFLASIDWTSTERAPDGVRSALADVEAWSTEFSEGDLTRDEYLARLQRLVAVR